MREGSSDSSGVDAYLDHDAARGYTDPEEAGKSAVARWNALPMSRRFTTVLRGGGESLVTRLVDAVVRCIGVSSKADYGYQGDVVITRPNDRA